MQSHCCQLTKMTYKNSNVDESSVVNYLNLWQRFTGNAIENIFLRLSLSELTSPSSFVGTQFFFLGPSVPYISEVHFRNVAMSKLCIVFDPLLYYTNRKTNGFGVM